MDGGSAGPGIVSHHLCFVSFKSVINSKKVCHYVVSKHNSIHIFQSIVCEISFSFPSGGIQELFYEYFACHALLTYYITRGDNT